MEKKKRLNKFDFNAGCVPQKTFLVDDTIEAIIALHWKNRIIKENIEMSEFIKFNRDF